MLSFANNKEVNYWKLLSVEVLEWNWIFLVINLFDIFLLNYPHSHIFFFFFWVEYAIEYKKHFWFLQISLGEKKKTILAHWFVIHFPWQFTQQFRGLEVWCWRIFNIWPPNSEGRHRADKNHRHLHDIVWDPIFNKGGETQWGQHKYQTFLCSHLESNWPRLKLFDEWLSGTYMADGDFSLMADWACQQSHYNLQFDMLQAELFDSHDSDCHPQS